MSINYDEYSKKYYDANTGLEAKSKNQLNADIIRKNLGLPIHPFLSNRFVLNNIEESK